jgi:hypothetical protein
MHLKYLIVLLLLICNANTYGNADTLYRARPFGEKRPYRETALKLLTGAHLQMAKDQNDSTYSRKLLEIGMHHTITVDGLRHPLSALTLGPSLEFSLGEAPVYGFKFGGWINANLMTLGISSIYYTDFHRGNFKIRPEFGVGFHAAKLTMGINIPTIANRDFFPLKSSLIQLSLNLLLKVKTIKKEYGEVPEFKHSGNYN